MTESPPPFMGVSADDHNWKPPAPTMTEMINAATNARANQLSFQNNHRLQWTQEHKRSRLAGVWSVLWGFFNLMFPCVCFAAQVSGRKLGTKILVDKARANTDLAMCNVLILIKINIRKHEAFCWMHLYAQCKQTIKRKSEHDLCDLWQYLIRKKFGHAQLILHISQLEHSLIKHTKMTATVICEISLWNNTPKTIS